MAMEDTVSKGAVAATVEQKQLKGVIFDIDGTLANSWQLGFDATNVVLKKHGIPVISPEVYHQGTKYTTPNRLARHAGLEPGHVDFDSRGNELAAEFDELYIGLVSTETAGFYAGITQLLNRISRTVALGVLTNAAVEYAHAVLQENGRSTTPGDDDSDKLYTRFQSIRGADNVPKPKPEPDGLWQVCQDLSLKPDQCVYIGDSPSDGVAAVAAGMPFVGVTWGSHSRESLSKVHKDVIVCDSIAELQSVLQTYGVITNTAN